MIFCLAACEKSEEGKAGSPQTEVTTIPDTRLSGTFWLYESPDSFEKNRYTGLMFADESRAELLFFDNSGSMQTEKGEYTFLNDAFGAFYYNSIKNYVSRLNELRDSYRANGKEKSESDIKDELFRTGGIELLFQLKDSQLEIFGCLAHAKDLGLNVLGFTPVTFPEFQKIFTDYRKN